MVMVVPILVHPLSDAEENGPTFRVEIGAQEHPHGIWGAATNLSPTSVILEGDFPLASGIRLEVVLVRDCMVRATIDWSHAPYFGCQFDAPVASAVVEAALLSAGAGDEEAPGHAAVPIVNFGANLKRLRDARGISQRMLAKKLGVSIPTVSMWEGDHRKPSFKRLDQICELLGVSPGELIGGAESTELSVFLAQSRERIARILGTTPDKVRIMIEL